MDLRKRSSFFTLFQHYKHATAIFCLSLLIPLFLFIHPQSTRFFPIKIVHVHGVKHINQAEIQTLITPLLQQGFFNINIALIRERLAQMPWVAAIFVRRAWPDKIEINLVEKEAKAIWNDTSLLSPMGELFNPPPASYPVDLPRFSGPNAKQMVMLKYFAQMNRLLTPLHAKISSLELSPYYTWKLTLNNGMSLRLGHKDVLARLQHFVTVYPKIIGEQAEDVEYIDLRYSNGMAVKWKTPN